MGSVTVSLEVNGLVVYYLGFFGLVDDLLDDLDGLGTSDLVDFWGTPDGLEVDLVSDDLEVDALVSDDLEVDGLEDDLDGLEVDGLALSGLVVLPFMGGRVEGERETEE